MPSAKSLPPRGLASSGIAERFLSAALPLVSALLLLALLYGFYVVVRVQRETRAQHEFLHASILDQGSSLNRVAFAVAEYGHGRSLSPGALTTGILESAHSILSQASIPPMIDPGVYARFITDDVLGLTERLEETQRAYEDRLADLEAGYRGLFAAGTTAEKGAGLERFDSLFEGFLTALKDRSHVLTMLEATYHAKMRSDIGWMGRESTSLIVVQSAAVLLALIVGFLSLHAQSVRLRVLQGLIPICASCKKVRDDQGYWQQVESYISSRTEADFSHGICPDCMKRLYPGL